MNSKLGGLKSHGTKLKTAKKGPKIEFLWVKKEGRELEG